MHVASRRVVATSAVVLLALLGAVALGVGIAMRTVWLPDDQVTATARLDGTRPLVVSAPGLLEMRPGPVTVTATSPDDAPVLIARGREEDVQAWVGDAAHHVLTGLSGPTALEIEDAGTPPADADPADPADPDPAVPDPAVPDPAGSDLWVQSESGTGEASLTWDDPQGRWLLLFAGDGTAPAPQEVSLTWPREVTTPWSTPLTVTGAVLLALASAGAAAIVVWVRRTRRTRRIDRPEATA